MTARNPGGRPRLAPGLRLDCRVVVPFTAAQLAAVEAAAEADGLHRAEYIRRVLDMHRDEQVRRVLATKNRG